MGTQCSPALSSDQNQTAFTGQPVRRLDVARYHPLALGALLAFLVSGPTLAASDSAQLVSTDITTLASVEESGGLSTLGDAPPVSRNGECYARVLVPPQYQETAIDVVVREASQGYDITPAKIEARREPVVVRDAHVTLTPVQPRMDVRTRRHQIAPASSAWVRGDLDSTIPVSQGDLRDLEIAGIDLDDVPMGQCVQEYFTPPTSVTVTERVLVRDASEELSATQATFRTDTITVETEPAYTRLIDVPAVFSEQSEQVLVQMAATTWVPGVGPGQRIDTRTGESVIPVELPAKSETYTRQVLEQAALVTSVEEASQSTSIDVHRLVSDAVEYRRAIPAEYDDIEVDRPGEPGAYSWVLQAAMFQPEANTEEALDNSEDNLDPAAVLDDSDVLEHPTGRVLCHRSIPAEAVEYDRMVVLEPGRFDRVENPPETVELSVRRLIKDASSTAVQLPAETASYLQRTLVADARTEWRESICESDISNQLVARLQQALDKEGHSPGVIDGLMGRGTMTAIKLYQEANELASGALTVETLHALNITQ